MKNILKVYESQKYGIIIIYFNFIIALNLIINVILSQSSSNYNSDDQDNVKSDENSENSSNPSVGFSWGGYIAALILLNSILVIKCKQIKEKWHFWIKQIFLSITLLLVILVMNLSENQSLKKSIQGQIQKTLQTNDNFINLYCNIKYQTGQISLFSLISLIEVLPFQLILIIINQVYFIFIRQEIYSANYTDQIIFFAVYSSSIFIFIFLQRFQNNLFCEYNEFNGKSNYQIPNMRKNNLSSGNFDLRQDLQNSVFKRSERDIGNNNEIRLNDDGSYSQRQNILQFKETQNNYTSRPLFKYNTFQKEASQIYESTHNFSKNIFEEQDPIFQSSLATYEMKFSGDFQKLDSPQICNFHKEQLNKEQNVSKNQRNISISSPEKLNIKKNSFQNEHLSSNQEDNTCPSDCQYQSLSDRISRNQNKYQNCLNKQISNSDGYDNSKTNIVESHVTFQQSNSNNIQNNQINNYHRTRKISHFRDDSKQDDDNKKEDRDEIQKQIRLKSSSLKEMKHNIQSMFKQNNFLPQNFSSTIIQNQMAQNKATLNNINHKSIGNKFLSNNYINNKLTNNSSINNIFSKNNINQHDLGNKPDNHFEYEKNKTDQFYYDQQNRNYSEQNQYKDQEDQSKQNKLQELIDKSQNQEYLQKEYDNQQETNQQENQNLRVRTTNSIYNNNVTFNQNVSYMVQQPHQQTNKNHSTSGSYVQFQDGNQQIQFGKNVHSNESYHSIDNPQNISLDCASISYDIRQRPSIFSKKTIKRCNSMDHTQMKNLKRQNRKYTRNDSDGDDHVYQKSVFGLDKLHSLNGVEMSSMPHRPNRYSETSCSPNFSHRNLSVIYQVFFNFFPEGQQQHFKRI